MLVECIDITFVRGVYMSLIFGNMKSYVIGEPVSNSANHTNFEDAKATQDEIIRTLQFDAMNLFSRAKIILNDHGFNYTSLKIINSTTGQLILKQLKQLSNIYDNSNHSEPEAKLLLNSSTSLASLLETSLTSVTLSTTTAASVDVSNVYPLRERWNVPYPVNMYRYIIQPLVESMGVFNYLTIKDEIYSQLCKLYESKWSMNNPEKTLNELVESLEELLGINPNRPPKFDKFGDSEMRSHSDLHGTDSAKYTQILSRSNSLLSEYKSTACARLRLPDSLLLCTEEILQRYSTMQATISLLTADYLEHDQGTCGSLSECERIALEVAICRKLCAKIDASKTTLRTRNFVSNHLWNSSLFADDGNLNNGKKTFGPSLTREAAALKTNYSSMMAIHKKLIEERNMILVARDQSFETNRTNCDELLIDTQARVIKNLKEVFAIRRQLLVVSGLSELDILDAYTIEIGHKCELEKKTRQLVELMLNNN